MLIRPPPTPNIERQRQFRERNPGYYGRLNRRRRAQQNAYAELLAHMPAEAAALAAVRGQTVETLALAAAAVPAPARTEPLMLPAPVVDPMMRELNALAAKLARAAQAVEIPIHRSTAA